MTDPPRYRPDRFREAHDGGDPRHVARWLLGFIATVALLAAFSSVVLFQVTAEGPAKDALRRSAAALTEIDALLARHEEDLRADADNAATGDTLELEDYPIAIGLTPDDVQGNSHEELRALILDRSAERLYEDGTGVLRESAEGRGSIGIFSITGITDRGLGTLTDDNHTMFGILALVLLVGAAGLIAATAATCRGWGRLTAVGVILMLGGALTLVVGWFSMWSAGSSASEQDEFVRAELFRVLEDLAMAPVRDGAAAFAAGVVIIIGAMAAGIAARAEASDAAIEAG